jgi:hypothetical protein
MDTTNINTRNLRIYVMECIFIENFIKPSPNIQYAVVCHLTLRVTLVTISVTSFLIL